MPLKTIKHPATGQSFKMGRNQPAKILHAHENRLSMRRMMNAGVLPDLVVPETTNYSMLGAVSLNNVYKNDSLGDCVIAGGFHVRGVTSANGGNLVIFTDDQVIQDYSAIGGYVPGDLSTDNGCDENTALAYWLQTGFPDGVKLLDQVAVDATDEPAVRMAQFLFENLYFGVNLPDAWVSPMPGGNGFDWDSAGNANPDNGHCFIGSDLVSGGIQIDTWGMCGTITQEAIAEYAIPANGGQLFSLLSPDVVNRIAGKSPAGYSIETLLQYIADFKLENHSNSSP